MNPSLILKQNKLRSTPVRQAVLTILANAAKPLDVQELHTMLDRHGLKPDLVTLYRTLDTFIAHQLVKTVNLNDNKLRYELEGEHHHHLVCQQCGSITPIHEPCIAVTESTVLQKYGFEIKYHTLEFFGICKKCRKTLNLHRN
jgi:Fur family ferric uptake transcriptional regulator